MSKFSAKFNTKILAYSAICIALAAALQLISLPPLPYGGSTTLFSMLFVTLIGYFFGPYIGIVGGLVYGLLLLSLAKSADLLNPIQIMLDFPIACTFLGFSGFFSNKKFGLQIGYVTACFLRYIIHVVSGYFFWYMFAPEGQGYMIYSITYNLAWWLPEVILTLVVLSLPPVRNAIKMVKSRAS